MQILKFKHIIILSLLIFGTIILDAQPQNIKIFETDVTNSNAPEEPSICINPENTQQIIVGANISNCFKSDDGGLTWTSNVMTSTYNVAGDPCVIVDSNGDFYYFHLSNASFWLDRIVCQKLTDFSGNWTDGTFFGINGTKEQSKQWATFDRKNKIMYCTWNQFDDYGSTSASDFTNILFTKSDDYGNTWSSPAQINQKSGVSNLSNLCVEGSFPVIGANGEIFVSWIGLNENNQTAIIFDKSEDYGNTWLENDIKITDLPGGWLFPIPGISRGISFPVMSCDTSGGSFNGNIYLTWADQRNGTENTDVFFVKSTDNGSSWTQPQIVNNDNSGKHQFFSAMAVDQITGNIFIVFYDRRNYENEMTDVYLAVSEDGGETFENYKISEEPFLPYEDIFFGDYNSISAHNNIVRPAWTNLNGNNIGIYTALIDWSIGINIKETKNIFENNLSNYPNPFNETSYISFKLRSADYVNLSVFDIYGNKVTDILTNEYLTEGKYVKTFNARNYNLNSGIYFYVLNIGTERHLSKIIFSK